MLFILQADQICYAVLCVFSYVAAGLDQQKKPTWKELLQTETDISLIDTDGSNWTKRVEEESQPSREKDSQSSMGESCVFKL